MFETEGCSIRYFLGFTVSGLAAPFLAALHGNGGFARVLAVTAMIGGVVFGCALSILAMTWARDER